ncbi:MAG: signal peptidase II [Planctomycetaceae bacterium]
MPTFPAKSWRVLMLVLLSISCIGCDQATKQIAATHLTGDAAISYLGDTLRLCYAENPGAFLGLGGTLSASSRFWFLIIVNAVLLTGVAWALLVPARVHRLNCIALGLILTGGIGNLIDRVGNDGLVTDFLNLGLGPIRTGIFNVADVAISTGAVLLTLSLFRGERTPPVSE